MKRFATPILLLLLSSPIALQAAEPGLDSTRLDAICKCVVRVFALKAKPNSGDTKPELRQDTKPCAFATGFIIRCNADGKPIRSDGKPIIITAAHAFNGLPFVTADGIECDLIDVNDAVDLMALMPRRPISAPPLTPSATKLQRGDYVCLFGCPLGMKVVQDRGEYKGWLKADEMPEGQLPSLAPGIKIPRGETELIMYNAANAPGKSGGPLVDKDGKVVAVNNSRLPDGPGECFGVSIKHLADLNLGAKPDSQFRKGVAMLHLNLQPAAEVLSAHSWLTPSNAADAKGRFFRIADVPRNAEQVIDDFFEQSSAFRREMGQETLEAILEKRSLERIISPDFGFELLVPKGLKCVPEVTYDPSGVRLTVKTDDSTIVAPYNSFTVQAFTIPDRFLHDAVVALDEHLAASGYPPDVGRSDDPSLKADFRRAFMGDYLALLWKTGVPLNVLHLRIRGPESGAIVGRTNQGESYIVEDLDARSKRKPFSFRFRENLVSESSDQCYAVHGCVHDNALIVAYYAFSKADARRVTSGQKPSDFHLTKILMRSSLSSY